MTEDLCATWPQEFSVHWAMPVGTTHLPGGAYAAVAQAFARTERDDRVCFDYSTMSYGDAFDISREKQVFWFIVSEAQ